MSTVSKGLKTNQISTGSNILLNIMFIIGAILCIGPILLVIAISFTDEHEILINGYSFIPKVFSLKAYDYMISAGDMIWHAYGISILVTVVGTFLAMLIICMYAYPLSRNSFKYKNQFAFLAYFTMIFGGGLVPSFVLNLLTFQHPCLVS